ncbi:dihydrodipicolinate synthase family protein [Tessaracoccus oleiagri]|uniref:Dihydrodipicolinate synthase/N-acetylneuraminate lyase n=1 Tax=Tessaracoccus oleiagri TaxID=686624 RepID=A0A1G9HGU6_9ACTN|nr:hypothetical protein [Tessaracoccus oleiagri]SDL11954.1 hypothetical protein SAMN04488242_0290 [Tessaracoccus oleiagri]
MTHVLGQPPYTIPAHPFAVDAQGRPDWASQRLVTRYYLAAGATGLAVGVHTTQFEIHDDPLLFRRVLREAAEVRNHFGPEAKLVAGICGDTPQAVEEAHAARDLGYVAGLLSTYGMTDRSEQQWLERSRAVAEVMPIMGFYMQESVGGQYFSPGFWEALLQIDNLVAIKVAPFDRYRTADVAEALALSGRTDVALLTGNDDAILSDLMLPHRYGDGLLQEVRFSGGLLGQWAVGTRAAGELTRRIWEGRDEPVTQTVLAAATAITSINQAVFDPEHGFAGSIAGVNEMLRQQGLMASSRCLSDHERLADGQAEKIRQARRRYPELTDEDFIAEHLDEWRRDVDATPAAVGLVRYA